MLVVFRCIPCEECVKLDDDLFHQNKRIQELLPKFTCVRIVSTNGLDLSLFQYDYDQSFAAFLLNADGVVYGRYGTRSHRTYWSDDVSIEGLARAMEGALELHRQYPGNKAELAARKGPAPAYLTPEKYPSLKDRYKATLDYKGKVVPSCIHCHQVGEAQRQVYLDKKQPIPEQLLLPYPHPKILGLILDPRERASVLRVEADSLAHKAGFKKGDVIMRLQGQTLLSIADVQWVLHQTAPDGATLKAVVQRGGRPTEILLTLPRGWRQADNISWRVSTWALRRRVLGGMLLKTMTAEERKQAGLKDMGMALRVDWVGTGSGPHGAAARAGVQKGDIIVSYDGRHYDRETDVIVSTLRNHQPGDMVEVTVQRNGKKNTLKVPVQN